MKQTACHSSDWSYPPLKKEDGSSVGVLAYYGPAVSFTRNDTCLRDDRFQSWSEDVSASLSLTAVSWTKFSWNGHWKLCNSTPLSVYLFIKGNGIPFVFLTILMGLYFLWELQKYFWWWCNVLRVNLSAAPFIYDPQSLWHCKQQYFTVLFSSTLHFFSIMK